MKKLFLTLIIISLLLTACTGSDGDLSSDDSKDSLPSEEFNSSVTSSVEESVFSSEESYLSSEESYISSEESHLSSEESDITSEESYAVSSEDDSSEDIQIRPLSEITAEIASMKEAGFSTNLENSKELEALKAYLENSGYGYFYCDLEYNAYVSYGCNKNFKTASTAKLPYIKYLYTLADKGEIDLSSAMVYEQRHHTIGSGIMKNMTPGGSFTVAKLMDYVLRYSDNIAYNMLMERFGLKGYLESVAELGVDYTTENGYSNCTASEMAALLYDVALYNGAGLEAMKNAGCNASYNYQIGAELKEYDVLQKYGAIKPGNIAYHDIAVVYAPHSYILVIYTTIDYDSSGKNVPFRTIARLTDDLNKSLYGEQ